MRLGFNFWSQHWTKKTGRINRMFPADDLRSHPPGQLYEWGPFRMERITKCWSHRDPRELIGACDCVNACAIKSEIVDLLCEVLEHHGLDAAANAAAWMRREWPEFSIA